MQLSERTISILKNFATINDSLLFKAGNLQRTIDSLDTIQCDATIDEEFPQGFGIYDLRTFLANVAALKNPDITFGPSFLTITDGNITIDYFYASPKTIKSPSDGAINLGKPDVTFTLTNQTFQRLIKIADLNGMPILKVIGKGGEIIMRATDNTDTSNIVDMKVDSFTGDDFSVTFTIDNLKLLPDDYEVSLYVDGLCIFENVGKTLKYYITLDQQ